MGQHSLQLKYCRIPKHNQRALPRVKTGGSNSTAKGSPVNAGVPEALPALRSRWIPPTGSKKKAQTQTKIPQKFCTQKQI